MLDIFIFSIIFIIFAPTALYCFAKTLEALLFENSVVKFLMFFVLTYLVAVSFTGIIYKLGYVP